MSDVFVAPSSVLRPCSFLLDALFLADAGGTHFLAACTDGFVRVFASEDDCAPLCSFKRRNGLLRSIAYLRAIDGVVCVEEVEDSTTTQRFVVLLYTEWRADAVRERWGAPSRKDGQPNDAGIFQSRNAIAGLPVHSPCSCGLQRLLPATVFVSSKWVAEWKSHQQL